VEPVRYYDLGRISYETAYTLQKTLVTLLYQQKVHQCLLLLEHDPIYTIGKAGKGSPPEGTPHIYVDRGGDITYHGPGQLVGYPILRLQSKKISSYIYKLENSLIALLKKYHISGSIKEGFPGVWVGTEKISSIGIRVTNNITYHGFALNVNTCMEAFKKIRPCNMDVTMTSMEILTGKNISMDDIKMDYCQVFAQCFQVPVTPGDVSLLLKVVE